jgi:hypothetical protein
MILIAFRHGLRASELVDLRWEQTDLDQAANSVVPEVPEAARREFRVPHGVRDVPMTEVRLQGPGVRPSVGESIAGCVSEHMWMRLDPKSCCTSGPLDHPPEA